MNVFAVLRKDGTHDGRSGGWMVTLYTTVVMGWMGDFFTTSLSA